MNPFLLRLLSQCWLLPPDWLRVHIQKAPRRIDVPLLLLLADGSSEPLDFRLDTGATMSSMSLERARRLGLDTSGPRQRIVRQTPTGIDRLVVIRGRLRFRLSDDQWAAPFDIPINFIPGQHAGVPPLLGLVGASSQLRYIVRGRSHGDFPDGSCLVFDDRPASERYPA